MQRPRRPPGRAFLGLLAAVVLLLAGCATTPGEPTPKIFADSGAAQGRAMSTIDTIVAEEMAAQQIPGVAVAVVKRGQVIRAAGFGLANVEHSVPVTPQTVFQTGSLAKQFTAVAVMLQVEDGKLGLDDPVTRHLPGAPAAWHAITVRHLLTHTSGLANYDATTLDYRRDYTEDELMKFAFGLPLAFPAGTRWSYSDTGYVLLGVIVRKVSGQFYGDVLRDRVFGPLGMTSARVISEEDIVMQRAGGYRRVDGALKNQSWVAPSLNTTADGSLYLSLQDWLRWEQALRQRVVLNSASWQQVFTPVRLNSGKTYPHGFGWMLHDGRGPAWYGHDGAWQGFQASYLHATDADLSVIVLANLAEADPARIARRLAQLELPALQRPATAAVVQPDPALVGRVRTLLEATVAGTLRAADFEFVPAGFFPGVPADYRALLQGRGPVERVELLEQWELGDDTAARLRAVVAGRSFLVDVSFTPAGRVSSYGLRVEPRSE